MTHFFDVNKDNLFNIDYIPYGEIYDEGSGISYENYTEASYERYIELLEKFATDGSHINIMKIYVFMEYYFNHNIIRRKTCKLDYSQRHSMFDIWFKSAVTNLSEIIKEQHLEYQRFKSINTILDILGKK
jgi:hypothetical protein